MRPLPFAATTTREESNQSAAAQPSLSFSPPPFERERREEKRGDELKRNEIDSPPSQQQLLETEKLRAGIQHLLSSAPIRAQSQLQKRQEATPRRRGTPRRAAAPTSTSTKKTPAAGVTSASASASKASSLSSLRPYKAQLALFSVSKPALLPGATDFLRSYTEKGGMEDQVSWFIGIERRDSPDQRKNARRNISRRARCDLLTLSFRLFRLLFLSQTTLPGASPGCGGSSRNLSTAPSYRSERLSFSSNSKSSERLCCSFSFSCRCCC